MSNSQQLTKKAVDLSNNGDLFYNKGDKSNALKKYQLSLQYYQTALKCMSFSSFLGNFDTDERISQVKTTLERKIIDLQSRIVELGGSIPDQDRNEKKVQPTNPVTNSPKLTGILFMNQIRISIKF